MLTIAKLFGKSPFAPLQTHMDKVARCVGDLPKLFQAALAQDMALIQQIADQISHLEHEADLTKNDIRNHLPKSLFLPVDRGSLLEILSLQDSLADQAEEIAHHAGRRRLELLPSMREDFNLLCRKSVEICGLAKQVIVELQELLECSFGGIEAEKVKRMVEAIAFHEYEITQTRNRLIKNLYQDGDELPYPAFHFCLSWIEKIGELGHFSEKLGNRVRMLLELK